MNGIDLRFPFEYAKWIAFFCLVFVCNFLSAAGDPNATAEEMGVPQGLSGTVDSISACPAIETGSGRVVLMTVSHLNSYVFTLTLTGSSGVTDNIGITGYHKVYSEARGWVNTCELGIGEQVRTAEGTATVAGLVQEAGSYRVYNMTVEADHVYYVGDLSALVHNSTCSGNVAQVTINRATGNAFRDQIADALRKAGYEVETEVFKATPFGRRFIDVEVSRGGQVLGGIEAMVGRSWYGPLQRLKDAWLSRMNNYPVTLVRHIQ